MIIQVKQIQQMIIQIEKKYKKIIKKIQNKLRIKITMKNLKEMKTFIQQKKFQIKEKIKELLNIM